MVVVSEVKFDETDHEQLQKLLEWLNIRQLTDFDTALLIFQVVSFSEFVFI